MIVRRTQYGEYWLDRHFPDWRRLLRMDVDPGATAEDVENAMTYALKATSPEMGAVHLELIWRGVHEPGSESRPPHPSDANPTDRNLARVLIREVIGDLLAYARELGESPQQVLSEVFGENPELEQG